jgi:predicted ribosome quality control (RQC) complex YloA/Tae2 family protein
MKHLKVGNYTCLVGQNAEENWSLLKSSNKKDILFHLSKFPSCYVILRIEDQEPNLEVIEQVAKICLDNTKYKNLKNVYVDYTVLQNVRKGDYIGELEFISLRKVSKVRI